MENLLNEYGNPDLNSKWYKVSLRISKEAWALIRPILDEADLSLPELRMVLMNFPGWLEGDIAAYLIKQQTLKYKEERGKRLTTP